MVEMSETANILHNATDLPAWLLMDERSPRGYPGTLMGLFNMPGRRQSIWSDTRFSLFATHYFELTKPRPIPMQVCQRAPLNATEHKNDRVPA